jgi:hypothetical protein
MTALEQRIEEIRHGFDELLADRLRIRVQHDDTGQGSQFGVDNEMGREQLSILFVVVNSIRIASTLRERPLSSDNVEDWVRCVLVRKEGVALACGDVRRA